MRYKALKNAGIEVSELTIGTWGYDPEWWGDADKKVIEKTMYTAIDRGVNLVDTAARYGNGKVEQFLSTSLTGSYRDKVYLCSKFGTYAEYIDGNLKLHRDSSYKKVLWECEQSLSRLNMDCIDVYFQHWPDNETGTTIEETMSALNELVKQGKIRWIGFSNTSIDAIKEAQKYGTVSFIQPQYSLVKRDADELMRFCHEQGIATITYGSLGGGILTGAFRTIPDWPATDARYKFYDVYKEPKFSKIMELMKLIDKIAADHKATPCQVALNWLTQKEYVASAISGFRKVERANENCDAFDWTLSEGEIAELTAEADRLGL